MASEDVERIRQYVNPETIRLGIELTGFDEQEQVMAKECTVQSIIPNRAQFVVDAAIGELEARHHELFERRFDLMSSVADLNIEIGQIEHVLDKSNVEIKTQTETSSVVEEDQTPAKVYAALMGMDISKEDFLKRITPGIKPFSLYFLKGGRYDDAPVTKHSQFGLYQWVSSHASAINEIAVAHPSAFKEVANHIDIHMLGRKYKSSSNPYDKYAQLHNYLYGSTTYDSSDGILCSIEVSSHLPYATMWFRANNPRHFFSKAFMIPNFDVTCANALLCIAAMQRDERHPQAVDTASQ